MDFLLNLGAVTVLIPQAGEGFWLSIAVWQTQLQLAGIKYNRISNGLAIQKKRHR